MKLFLLFLFGSFGAGAFLWKATALQRAGIAMTIVLVLTCMYFFMDRFI